MATTNALAQYDPNQVNLLVPTQHLQQVSPWHAVRVQEVRIDPNPERGDVFKVGSRPKGQNSRGQTEWEELYAPAKPALMRVASAAGIVWNWRESGPESVSRDYVLYKAVGAVRLPDGTWQPIVARKEIDLLVIEEETREANLKKGRELAAGDAKAKQRLGGLSPEQWAEQQTRSAMIQWRKNKLMRAETGAMLRVIRAALGMRSQYTREELQKPFVVPRIDFSPDYSDPEVRRALIEHGAQAMGALFGASAPQPAIAAPMSGPQAALAPPIEPDPGDDDEPWTGASEVPEDDAAPDDEPPPPDDSEAPPEGGQPGLFPEAGQQGEPDGPVGFCTDCHKPIKQAKVYDYSKQHFGRPLCYGCQQKVRKGGAA